MEVQCVAAGVTELANPRQLVVVEVARVYSPWDASLRWRRRTADVWPASVLQCLSAVTPPPVITLTGASALWHSSFPLPVITLTGDSALRFEASCEFFKGWENKAIKISRNRAICLLGCSTPECNNQWFFSGKGIKSAEIDSPYAPLLMATNQGAKAPLMKLAGCSGLITITNDTPSRVPPPFCLVCCRPAAPTPAQHQTLIRPCPPPS